MNRFIYMILMKKYWQLCRASALVSTLRRSGSSGETRHTRLELVADTNGSHFLRTLACSESKGSD
jgi:hypothetical protein